MADEESMPNVCSNTQQLGGWRWLIVYGLLSLLIQWPLVGSLTTHISYGHEREITVPMLNLWTVWWNADRAAQWFQGYWNAPIFYPTQKTLIFSEAQPSSLIVAPVLGLTGNRVLAYNLYQLLILTLNGFTAHRLLRRLGHIRWLAFCGGVMSQTLPFVMWQFGVVQLTTLFGIHCTIHAVLDLLGVAKIDDASKLSIEPRQLGTVIDVQSRSRDFSLPIGLRLGLAFGLTYWLCNYWGLFLTLLLLPSSVCLWNRRMVELRFWRQLGWAALISFAMIGPIAWLQHSQSREHAWQSSRNNELVRQLSANWRDHTDVPWKSPILWFECPDVVRNDVWTLGGGGLKLLLVPIGLVASLFTHRRRRWGLFATLFGLLAFALSLGPTVRIRDDFSVVGGFCVYEWLQHNLPGFSLIRSPFRFAVFVQLAAVWLSIEALDLLNPGRWSPRRTEDSAGCERSLRSNFNLLFEIDIDQRFFYPKLAPLVLCSVFVTLETAPPTTRLYELPSPEGAPTWVVWLRDASHPADAVACLPFPRGSEAKEYEETTVWMYWSTFHRHPLVNGYSGFFPADFMKTKEGLEQFRRSIDHNSDVTFQPTFKSYSSANAGLKRLNAGDARYIVMKRSFGTEEDVFSNPLTRSRWKLVQSDETAQIDVYEILKQGQ